MNKDRDRVVYKREDGNWANKRNDASRASSVHGTQQEAIEAARGMLGHQGGGEQKKEWSLLSLAYSGRER